MQWPAPDPRPVIRFSLPLPDGQALGGAELPMIGISPDGTRVAYVANRDVDSSGQRFLMIRQPETPSQGSASARQGVQVVVNWAEDVKARVPAP